MLKNRFLKAVVACLTLVLGSALNVVPSFADSKVDRTLAYVSDGTRAYTSALPLRPIPCTPRGVLTSMNIQIIDVNQIMSICGGGRFPSFIAGFRVSDHVAKHMAQRDIPASQIHGALTKGRKYYDPKEGSYPYYRHNLVVATKGKMITTVYESKGKPTRFQAVME